MQNLKDQGSFKLEQQEISEIKKDFRAVKIGDKETLSIIKEIYNKEKFIIDPHTATCYRHNLNRTNNTFFNYFSLDAFSFLGIKFD